MDTVREDFLVRVREVIACVQHVQKVSETAIDDSAHQTARSLRATIYLVAYNMVEATARNAICAIFDHLHGEKVSFDAVRRELKELVLTQVRKKKPNDLASRLGAIAVDIVCAAFEPEELFAGNVDARKLRETAGQLGYESNVRSDGSALLTIKDHRNDLAHGIKTFADVGRDVSMQDLRKQVASAIWYMRGVIRNIAAFVDGKKYLASNSS